jgi:hypothetical protein
MVINYLTFGTCFKIHSASESIPLTKVFQVQLTDRKHSSAGEKGGGGTEGLLLPRPWVHLQHALLKGLALKFFHSKIAFILKDTASLL